MSLISSKGMYGLAAMYELAQAKTSKPVQIKGISAKAGIPQNYLEQLLSLLRRAGLVSSVRGAHGGYLLAHKPEDILIKDIFVALEGSLDVVDNSIDNKVLDMFYAESNEKLAAIFEISLADLEQYQQRLSEQINYSI